MILIIDGTPGSNITQFLDRLKEESIDHTIISYQDWKHTHKCSDSLSYDHPEGIIYMRVMPEIAHKRLPSNINVPMQTLAEIDQAYQEKEQFYLQSKNNPKELEALPIIVLNGNRDFQTDFAQFYNHLFYIKKFINEIEKNKAISLGTYQEKPQRRCC